MLDRIGEEHRGKRFAIIINEAHSSQGGRTAAAMSLALSENGTEPEEETTEAKINRIIEARKLLPNASYFAFTATPKNKTLELFGVPYQVYAPEKIETLVELYLNGADRDQLDPILDACVAVYVNELDEDGQVDFKGKVNVFARISF